MPPPQDALDERVKRLRHEPLQLFPIAGVHGLFHKQTGAERQRDQVFQALLRRALHGGLLHVALQVSLHHPQQQIRDILKMIVERLSCDMAFVHNIRHGQLFAVPAQEQPPCRGCNELFAVIRHAFSLPCGGAAPAFRAARADARSRGAPSAVGRRSLPSARSGRARCGRVP